MSAQIGFVSLPGGRSGGAKGRGKALFRGFTLVELITVLLILAILATVGIPMFGNATLGSRLGSAANDLVASVHLARSEAIKRNTTVRLCPSSDGTSCSTDSQWSQGWIVIVASTSEVLQREGAVSGGISVLHKNAALSTAITTPVDMPATGIRSGGSDEAFLICRATPSTGNQERVVSVSATGRPSVKRTDTGTCS